MRKITTFHACIIGLMAGLGAATTANAATLQLQCRPLDNIDPTLNRFQFAIKNPRAVAVPDRTGGSSMVPNTIVVPIGADLTITGRQSNGVTVQTTTRMRRAVAPGQEFRVRRSANLSGRCSASARWR